MTVPGSGPAQSERAAANLSHALIAQALLIQHAQNLIRRTQWQASVFMSLNVVATLRGPLWLRHFRPRRFDAGPETPDGFPAALFYLSDMENSVRTSVLYNASCPVCNLEIQHYAQYASAHELPIRFDDLNSDARASWGLDADTAARRLYVLHEGELTSGIPAFLVLWAQMPRYRRLAWVIGLPGIRQIAGVVYDFVLAPAIYRWHLYRLRKQTALSRH